MQILDSQTTSVIVFTSQAEITRTASIELEQGEHTLIFDKLPQEITQKSIQVSGLGNATLSNVKFKTVHYQDIPDKNHQTLSDEKQQIEDQLQTLDDKIDLLNKEKKMLEGIASKITTPTEESQTELNPEKWLQMLDFYTQKLQTITQQVREIEKEKRAFENQGKKIAQDLQKLHNPQSKTRNQVEVIVEMHEKGELTLTLSYRIVSAGWKPYYDLRVSTETKKMNITYHAIIQQSTGEDWKDVSLKLSTAQPNVSGQQPEMNPWRIDIFKPVFYDNESSFGGFARNMMPAQSVAMEEQDAGVLSKLGTLEAMLDKPKMQTNTAIVETKSTSVSFNVAGKHHIKSDKTDHKVTILIEDFSAHLRYSAVPKLSPHAYLKAKVVNESEYPFLAGETNIFLDNNFVANAQMQAVAPTEEFWTFLGIDQAMKIEHKFLKKYEKKEGGVFTKKTKVLVFEYEMSVHNHKKTPQEIVVWNQLPISQNQSIKVQLLEPVYKEDTDHLKKNEYEYLEWFFKPKASEEIKIPFKFLVEFPFEASLEGLD
jgi:uncharacterized protein (TIGR02231 family)